MPAYTASNPSAAYRQQSVMTASPGQLVVMLYDGALRFLLQASTAMRAGDQFGCDAKLRRAEAIIDELHVVLDKERGGEIASRLEGIYVFCKRRYRGPHRARRGQDRQGLRAPRRAARGLGPDRRMNPWQDLLARAERELVLAREGRWEELAVAGAERTRLAAGLPAPAPAARPVLERLALVQEQLTALLLAPRAPRRRASSACSAAAAGPCAATSRSRPPAAAGWDESH